jgi:hypothetical protein
MTASELKAWLEGFEEALAGKAPNADQWKTIKSKIAKLQDKQTPTYHAALPHGWNDAIRLNEDPRGR